MTTKIGRRSLLKWVALAGALPIVAACQPQVVEKIVERPVEKIVERPVDRIIETEKIVEKRVEVVKEVTRIVEKPVEVVREKIVEKPVEVLKEVTRVVEKVVTVQPVGPKLFVLSNSKPHVTVIDTVTNTIVKTANIPAFTRWGWNDPNNYFDGQNIWLGLQNKEAKEAEYIALNVKTLEAVSRLSLGTENMTTYSGKALPNGNLLVGKMGAEELVAIDTKTFSVVNTWKVPVISTTPGHSDGKDSTIGKGVVCDMDVQAGPDGVYRAFYPTYETDAVISVNAETGETDKITDTPKHSDPWMGANTSDGTFWVQEGWQQSDNGQNSVFDAVTLELIKRFPAGQSPVDISFSPDEKLGYVAHSKGDFFQVVDTETMEEVIRVKVGQSPKNIAVHPNGKFVYAILSKEPTVAVVDTSSWKVVERIHIGTKPNAIVLASS